MKINVLLSTYNGELYIAEQLDSLLRQTVIDNIKIKDPDLHIGDKPYLSEL